MKDPVVFLQEMFRAGLAAVDPLKVVPPHLPSRPKGRIIVVGAGKAAARMAQAVEAHWGGAVQGLVVTQYGYGRPLKYIEVIEAAHPVPDDAGQAAALRMLEMVQGLTADDLVLCLFSGGGSSLLSLPAVGVSIQDKRALHAALVRSGAPIHEINSVRKHLSAIKGGRLALAAYPAAVHALVISDVPGDDPATVASGPTLADASTAAAALAVLDARGIEVPAAVRRFLEGGAGETPKPGDPRLARSTVQVVARAADMLAAAMDFAALAGVKTILLGAEIEGEAREVGAQHAQQALEASAPCILLSGGETTVTVTGSGKGGRNSEYALGAALALQGRAQIFGLAAATDGRDGNGGCAGAFFTPETLALAARAGIDAASVLAANDTFRLFDAVGGCVETGATCTNVNDFRALFVC